MTDSPSLMKLRILAGMHAGAEVKLAPGSYSIGSNLASDIVINDWPHSHSTLHLQADGACLDIRDAEGSDRSLVMAPLIALAVGVVVLVVAGALTAWPSDVEMLRALFGAGAVEEAAPSLAPVARPEAGASVVAGAGTGAWPVLMAAFLVLAVSVSLAVAAVIGERAPALIDAPSSDAANHEKARIDALDALLDRSLFPEVEAAFEDGLLSLRGWVHDAGQAELLREAVGGFAKVRHAYAVVEEVQSMISDRIAEPAAQVFYQSQGDFIVTGRVHAPQRARRAADAIRAELGASVASISFEFADVAEEDAVTPEDGRRTRSVVYLPDGSVVTTADGGRRFFQPRSK